ncbi:hypothetical protein Van01_01260 [Micromonospora andamanensis]|uniref:DNA ligase D 3'-phosphoesterase domain-containing protein n=1 Tax=Micromonospora andamanensis TaxID=1287068 RepID=A0ABQ4HMQ5_9ACTN|nr:hypothetical protein Van01_01260 [Micromonospora andamanensis]
MADRLEEYQRKRDAARTPEPVPAERPRRSRAGDRARFVIQQHHARSLHWDLRLERDGVLVSWAVPRGLPRDPGRNHLAVHTEDHPMEDLDFAGDIPAGEYGGGRMIIHDRGAYRCEKWQDREVVVELLWLEGVSSLEVPYPQRRELLDSLALSGPRGAAWT